MPAGNGSISTRAPWPAMRLGLAGALLFVVACGQPATQPTPRPTTAPPTTAPTAAPTRAAQPVATPAAQVTTTPAGQPTAAPATQVTAVPAAQPRIGAPMVPMIPPTGDVKDTIVLAMGQMPDTFHPLIGSMLARSEVLAGVFAYDVVNDHRGEWVAIGVEQVPTIDNGGARWVGEGDDRHLEVTFKIKSDLKWHDGTPTTSADVKFAWQLMLNPNFPATTRENSAMVWDIQTPDPKTAVVVYMSARQAREAAASGRFGLDAATWATFKDQRDPLVSPFYFALPSGVDGGAAWLPQHALGSIPPAEHKGAEFARMPLGNGPYRLAEVVPDQSIRLEAYDQWLYGAPHTRNLVFRIIPDKNAQIAAMRANEVDAVLQPGGPDVNDARELESISGYTAHFIPGTPWEHIDLYTPDPLLQDKNVRKALIMGINRQEIVERILNGRTEVAHSWVQPGVPPWAYDRNCLTIYNHDPAQARQLLEGAGFAAGSDGIYQKNGEPLRLRLQTTDATLRRNVAQVIQANLKEIGVDLQLEFMPSQAFFATDGPLTRGQFQLGVYTWLSSPDPDARTLYSTGSIPTADNQWSGQNFPRYSNAQFDGLMARGANELGIEQRKEIYCEAQRIWTDDVPVIPLFQRPVTTVARENLANFMPTPTNTPETWNMWAWYVPR